MFFKNFSFLVLFFSVFFMTSGLYAVVMDSITVFGFSQIGIRGNIDPQIPELLPDINIRAWSKWDLEGTTADDFNQTSITKYKQNNVVLIGGLTATVYFYDEAADSAEFKDMVTRNVENELVPHAYIYEGAYRGNMANPKFREYIVDLAKLQVDAGVDGIFFDEVTAGYSGNTFDGNEGYDDYHLKDFNRYLAARHPDYTTEQWFKTYQMDSLNFLDKNKPLDDIEHNFNYRKYVKQHGYQNNPRSNSLASVWGSITSNRPAVNRISFLEQYATDVYWKEIVTRVRDYAHQTYNKEILITSNGIFPYVDFNSVGLYNYNVDNNGKEANYVPVNSLGNLDGSKSLGSIFRSLYKRNRQIAGDVPCVLFIDWPTEMMTNYNKFTASEKMDYWRIYAAEAYAHGLFFAFHLKTTISSDPTAKAAGILDSLVEYSAFYKSNRSLFEKVTLTDTIPVLSSQNITATLISQKSSNRYLIHLINHNYEGTIKFQYNVTLTVPCLKRVKSVRLYSPDRAEPLELTYQQMNDTVTCTVDTLRYYSIIVLENGDGAGIKDLRHLYERTDENSSFFDLLGKVTRPASPGIYVVNKKSVKIVK